MPVVVVDSWCKLNEAAAKVVRIFWENITALVLLEKVGSGLDNSEDEVSPVLTGSASTLTERQMQFRPVEVGNV